LENFTLSLRRQMRTRLSSTGWDLNVSTSAADCVSEQGTVSTGPLNRFFMANKKRICYPALMDEHRKQATIAIVAAILAARKLATLPDNSPAYVSTISNAVSDARRIVEQVTRSTRP
jgi:hypothetical protein